MKRWSEVFTFSAFETWLQEQKVEVRGIERNDKDGKWTVHLSRQVPGEWISFFGYGTHMDSALREAMRDVEEDARRGRAQGNPVGDGLVIDE